MCRKISMRRIHTHTHTHTDKASPALIALGGIVFTTIISGLCLSSAFVSADDMVDEINITVPVSCSLSGTGQDSHNATINNGQYNSAIGETTIKAFCNDNEGFAIYAIGYTDDTDGKNVLTSPTLGSTYDIATGTATSGNTSNWAMKLTTITSPTPTYPIIIAGSTDDTDKEQGDPDYTTFQEVPDDYALVAKRKSGTDIGASAEGASFKTTYQAYISKIQPAGTYTGQVKYTLVHPHDATKPVIPVTIESAMQAAGKTKYNGYYKIQDMNSTICNNVNQYSGDGMAEVIDERDNNTYHIAKLADDRCWMLDNLALDPTDTTTAANMSANNTNATTEAITNYLNGGSSTTGWSNEKVSNVVYLDSDLYRLFFNSPYINNQSKDTLVVSYGPASTNNQAKVGIYYSFCAAMIGTYCYEMDYVGSLDTTNELQDICPAGWRMPTGSSAGEYAALYDKYNTTEDATSSASLQYNLSTPLSGGRYYYDDAYDQNSAGYWWSLPMSSTVTTYSGSLRITPGLVDYSFNRGRDNLYSMRCLVDE